MGEKVARNKERSKRKKKLMMRIMEWQGETLFKRKTHKQTKKKKMRLKKTVLRSHIESTTSLLLCYFWVMPASLSILATGDVFQSSKKASLTLWNASNRTTSSYHRKTRRSLSYVVGRIDHCSLDSLVCYLRAKHENGNQLPFLSSIKNKTLCLFFFLTACQPAVQKNQKREEE